MDGITPVGAMVQTPPPQNPLTTYADILGIKQQQQNLQTGQYQQQQQQGAAQLQQETMAERYKLQQMMQKGVDDQGNSILDANGQPDPDKLTAAATRMLPIIGQQVAQNVLTTQRDKTQLSESVRGLQQNYRNDLSGIVRSFVGKNATPQQIGSALDEYVSQNPDALAAAHWTSSLVDRIGPHVAPEQRDAALTHLAMQLQPASTTATQQTTAPVQEQGPAGPYFAESNRFAPGGAGTILSGSLPQGIAPHQAANSAGQIVNVGPGGQISVAGAAPAFGYRGNTVGGAPVKAIGNPNPASADVSAQQDDNTRYAQVSTGGTNAQSGMALAQQVQSLAEQVRTGKLSKPFADALAVLQQSSPGATARQLLSKYAAQLQTMALSGAPTDFARAQIESGMPNPDSMTPGAIEQASQYIGGLFGMNQARQKVADQYKQKNGSVVGIRQRDDAFMHNADPFVFAYQQLPIGPARQQFLREHGYTSLQKLQQLQSQIDALRQHGAF